MNENDKISKQTQVGQQKIIIFNTFLKMNTQQMKIRNGGEAGTIVFLMKHNNV